MEHTNRIIHVLDCALSQVKAFLHQLDSQRYQQRLELFSFSSTGQHTRHIIEFLQCLIEQCEEGIINYDKRKRNKKIEESPEYAIEVIDQLLEKLKGGGFPERLILQSRYDDRHMDEVETTMARELVYNIEHAIHHMAMIKIGLKVVAPELQLPVDFGVAPSTIKYRKELHKSRLNS